MPWLVARTGFAILVGFCWGSLVSVCEFYRRVILLGRMSESPTYQPIPQLKEK